MSEDLLNTKYKDKLEPSYKVGSSLFFSINLQIGCFVWLIRGIYIPFLGVVSDVRNLT